MGRDGRHPRDQDPESGAACAAEGLEDRHASGQAAAAAAANVSLDRTSTEPRQGTSTESRLGPWRRSIHRSARARGGSIWLLEKLGYVVVVGRMPRGLAFYRSHRARLSMRFMRQV